MRLARPFGPRGGEPDFCDDPNVTCARDAVVSSAQQAFAQGIGTFIFSIGGSVDRAHLQDVANAGSGQDVTDRQMAVFYQCGSGHARYAAQAGNAPFYEPNAQELEGMSMAEVAQAVALPESTALYRLQKARDEIRAYVTRRTENPPRRRQADGLGKALP